MSCPSLHKNAISKFFDRNPETGEIEREFGYSRMGNVKGREWEIEKPYMYIYRPDLTCKITAENGRVIIEDALGQPSPTDATLTGNVIVHIEPKETSSISESFLYLNDIIYIGDQSKITSTGPVRLVSDNARLNGQGMELVYNDEFNRLLDNLFNLTLDTVHDLFSCLGIALHSLINCLHGKQLRIAQSLLVWLAAGQ